MANITTVTLTSGVPTAGTGTVSTLDNLITAAGSSATNVLTVQGSATGVGIPVILASVPSHAVTNAGTFAVQVTSAPTTAVTGTFWQATQPVSGTVAATQSGTWVTTGAKDSGGTDMTDTTNHALKVNIVAGASSGAVAQGSTTSGQSGSLVQGAVTTSAPAYTTAQTSPLSLDTAGNLRTVITNANANGRALPTNSAPVVLNSMVYSAVAASQTSHLLGASGASGDYLDGVLIVPGTAAAGAVSIADGSGGAITIFAGGGTTALPTLAPFFVPIGAISRNGTGGWMVTTGANVTAVGIGNFT